MNNEIEYIEPTQEHVGQMVEVRGRENQLWKRRQFYGVIKHPLYRFVAGQDENGTPLPYAFARIARPLTYAERQARCGLKVGDRVRIVRAWEVGENGFDTASFLPHLQNLIGTKWNIKAIESNCMILEGIQLLWPYFVLEKVEDRVATHLDIGAKVYVTGSPEDEFELTHVYREGINDTFAVVRSGDKRFVYELSNLRVKE